MVIICGLSFGHGRLCLGQASPVAGLRRAGGIVAARATGDQAGLCPVQELVFYARVQEGVPAQGDMFSAGFNGAFSGG